MALKIETYEEETRESLEAYQRDTLAMCRTKGWAHLLGLLEIRREADSNILSVKDGDDLQKKKGSLGIIKELQELEETVKEIDFSRFDLDETTL